jgi:hypothetical protein
MAKKTEVTNETKTGALVLPDGFDPYDMALKKTINPEADEMNFIRKAKIGGAFLACGAKKHGTGKPCGAYAGVGTDHKGRGRCKNHGGACTGPVTPEGKAASSKNAVLHGLYSRVLMPWEVETFNRLVEGQELGLNFEIYLLKTKILEYLKRWQEAALQKYRDAKDLGATEDQAKTIAEKETKVWASFVSEDGNTKGSTYYHAMTIEDRALDRALRTLSNMIKAQAQLNPDQGNSLLNQINEELKAASFGRVSLSWGGKAPAIGGANDGPKQVTGS